MENGETESMNSSRENIEWPRSYIVNPEFRQNCLHVKSYSVKRKISRFLSRYRLNFCESRQWPCFSFTINLGLSSAGRLVPKRTMNFIRIMRTSITTIVPRFYSIPLSMSPFTLIIHRFILLFSFFSFFSVNVNECKNSFFLEFVVCRIRSERIVRLHVIIYKVTRAVRYLHLDLNSILMRRIIKDAERFFFLLSVCQYKVEYSAVWRVRRVSNNISISVRKPIECT